MAALVVTLVLEEMAVHQVQVLRARAVLVAVVAAVVLTLAAPLKAAVVVVWASTAKEQAVRAARAELQPPVVVVALAELLVHLGLVAAEEPVGNMVVAEEVAAAVVAVAVLWFTETPYL